MYYNVTWLLAHSIVFGIQQVGIFSLVAHRYGLPSANLDLSFYIITPLLAVTFTKTNLAVVVHFL